MIDEVLIYIAPPATARGSWRVRSDGCPEREFGCEEEAVRYAAQQALMVEGAGGTVVIKVERADGRWETYQV
jgi:hypothetical protein